MSSEWSYVWDIMVVSLFLGIATYIKRSMRFFEKFFIPNAIIAGFIGLLLGPQVLNLVKFDSDHLGNIVYHLMSVGFISLALKNRNREKNNDIVNTGFFIVNGYVLQGIVGFGLISDDGIHNFSGSIPCIRNAFTSRLRPGRSSGLLHRQAMGIASCRIFNMAAISAFL